MTFHCDAQSEDEGLIGTCRPLCAECPGGGSSALSATPAVPPAKLLLSPIVTLWTSDVSTSEANISRHETQNLAPQKQPLATVGAQPGCPTSAPWRVWGIFFMVSGTQRSLHSQSQATSGNQWELTSHSVFRNQWELISQSHDNSRNQWELTSHWLRLPVPPPRGSQDWRRVLVRGLWSGGGCGRGCLKVSGPQTETESTGQ